MKSSFKNMSRFFVCMLSILPSCQEESVFVYGEDGYKYIKPDYDNSEIRVEADTLQFVFPDTSYHKIKSFNLFIDGGNEYISMFDSKKQVILIYDLCTEKLITQMKIDSYIHNKADFHTTAFVRNFDSIYIFGNKSVQLFDSARVLKNTVLFLKETRPQILFYSSGNPPVFVGDKIYTGVKQPLVESSFDKLKKQKVIYEFDLRTKESSLCFNLPSIYYSQYYGYRHLNRSHCYSNRNKFVISFAADSNIYETDLSGYKVSYFGKSKYQTSVIKPVQKQETASEDEKMQSYYKQNDLYGSIFFDGFHERYLRVAYQKQIDVRHDFEDSVYRRQTLIIFDDHFRIIGESRIDPKVDCEGLFFTSSGEIYASLLGQKRGRSIQFVKLKYYEIQNSMVPQSVN